MKAGERWARGIGLDTSKKKDWEIRVHLATTGDLPEASYVSTKRASFWLLIIPYGFLLKLGVPLGRTDGLLEYQYVSWLPAAARWHQWNSSRKVPLKASQKLEPPTSLATVRKWLGRAEERLGVTFRRDRPGIQSSVKGGAKAMAAWIGAQ